MRLLYITYPDYIFTSGLIWNQVLSLLKEISRKKPDIQITLLSFVPVNEWLKGSSRSQIVRASFPEINIIALPAFFKRNWIRPFYPLFYVCTILVARIIALCVRPDLIQARGLMAGMIASRICSKKPWILDMRGVFPEEGVELGFWTDSSRNYHYWKNSETKLIQSAASINFVTETMREQFKEQLNHKLTSVIGSGVDISRFLPNQNGAQREGIKLIYSGSTGWEDLNSLKQIYRLFSRFAKNVTLLFLLPHTLKDREQEKICRFFTEERVEIDWCWPEQVPERLNQADIGIITRAPSLVTKVSLPTKCLEYWACGLPVVTTPNVVSINQWIQKEKIGILLDLTKENQNSREVEQLIQNCKAIGSHSRMVAEKNFSLSDKAENYLRLYENTLSNSNN